MEGMTQIKYYNELTDEEKAILVNVKGSWMSHIDNPSKKMFIKELGDILVICEEFLDKKD